MLVICVLEVSLPLFKDTHEEMQDITDVIAESLPSCASVLVDTKVFLHVHLIICIHVHVQ